MDSLLFIAKWKAKSGGGRDCQEFIQEGRHLLTRSIDFVNRKSGNAPGSGTPFVA
eukprot:m.71128 g.71128  ORF g.71128 m.71128 type:complete len:55 (+) comp35730_c0_seq1:1274-1438(+)